MLSPNGYCQKATAPSIWSFDSGYASNSLFEEEGVLQAQSVRWSSSFPLAWWLTVPRAKTELHHAKTINLKSKSHRDWDGVDFGMRMW